MTETILKMLEDPESDNDEVNARIFCYLIDFKFLKAAFDNGQYQGRKEYTTSLDAAMSIGAEELEGWRISINDEGDHYQVNFYNIELDKIIQGYCFGILPRAICHARLSALSYVRSQNEK